MIVSWPAGIKVKGSKTNQIGHVMDFMATFIDVAAAKYPGEYNGNMITPLEGKSLAPLFSGRKIQGHDALFNEHEGSKYVRMQDWKLVVAGPNKKWQLYDLSKDYSELNDLASQYPAKVKELSGMWDKWAAEHHVLPKPSK
jgi:arylsulfatase